MKKIWSLLFVIGVCVFGSCSVEVIAAGTQVVQGTSSIVFDKALEDGTDVSKGGNYYLASDVTLSKPLIIPDGITVNLDLNDHLLTNKSNSMDYSQFDGDVYTDSIIFVYGGTLNLYDTGSTERHWSKENDVIASGSTSDVSYNFTGGAITEGHNEKNLMGGGAICVSSGNFNMYSGNIVGNTTANDTIQGAGVYINTGATFTMYDGTFIGNYSKSNGGAIYNKGTVIINDGLISRNNSNEYANYGGGLYNAGTMTINGGTIQYNTAIGGGGISNVSKLTMTGGTIANNDTTGSAGAILNGWGATFTMSGGILEDNHTNGVGGAITLRQTGGVVNMSGGTIRNNTSGSYGAGVYMAMGTFNVSGSASIVDNTQNNKQNNVYLADGYTMTQVGDLSNRIGVTISSGIGTASVGGNGYTINAQNAEKYIADESYYRILETSKVVLKKEEIVQGTDQNKTYQKEAFDITNLELFDLTGLGDATYNVTPLTGEGTFDAETNKLTVIKIGTFQIDVKTTHIITAVPKTGTAIFTVEPKEVNISGLVAIERGPIEGNPYVELNTGEGTLDGVFDGDDVTIYYEDALAKLTDSNYDNDPTLNTIGTNTFAVSVTGLQLAGEDSGNYIIKEINDTTVTINMAIPYIAWPTATNIVYGQTQADSQLIGGKVIVKENGTYIDLTNATNPAGKFVWSDASSTIDNVGEISSNVKFVLNDSNSTPDYKEKLESAVHEINYQIEAAPVKFTITNNMTQFTEGTEAITGPNITAENIGFSVADGNTVDADNFVIQYRKSDETEVNNNVPTTVGTYYISAYFESDNYRHAGTMESTGKQIGVYNIYKTEVDKPTTYTVTFKVGDTAQDSLQITNSQAQDIHILPSIEPDKYYAWETVSGTATTGTIYTFGSRFPQPESDVVLKAVEKPASYTISGTITGTDLDGTENTGLSNIAVVLMQGNNLIATTETGTDGSYSFNAEAGYYTVVASRDQGVKNKISKFVDIATSNAKIGFELPDIRQNTVLNVGAGLPDITVKNIDTLFTDDSKNTITINMTGIDILETEKSQYDAIMDLAATDGLTADNLKLFMQLGVTERPGSQVIAVDKTSELLEIHIPLAGIYQDKEHYTVYRYNNGTVENISTRANADGEKIVVSDDKKSIILYVKQSDIYGIAFTEIDEYEGTDVTKVYQEDAFDLASLGMFAKAGEIGTQTRAYSMKPVTGVGTLTGNNLDVTSVGTFEITLTIKESKNDILVVTRKYRATLTVTPKEVNIEGLVTVPRGIITGDYAVQLIENGADDSQNGTVTGLVNNDSVSIDYANYSAVILEQKYDELDQYNEGKASFEVKVSDLQLIGEDSKNYTLALITNPSVDITYEIPDIAWPTPTNLTYLDTELPVLNGGKVVIKDEQGMYKDITQDGTFQWVDDNGNIVTTGSADITGSKTGKVMFVENDSTVSGGYHDVLKQTVREVEYKVESAPVEFTITNNNYLYGSNESISISGSYNNKQLATSDYKISYVSEATGAILENPTEVGRYFVAAEFTKNSAGLYNYHHIGTLESAGKQIGVLNIYEKGQEPTTYTVTFTGFPEFNITDAHYQDIHILPSAGDDYVGWQVEGGEFYEFYTRLPQQNTNIVLNAIAKEKEQKISGIVTGTDLNYYTDKKLSNISVMLKSGGDIIGRTTTDSDGYYEFNAPAGRYTLVFTRDQHGIQVEKTIFIDSTKNDVVYDILLPDIAQKTILDVDANVSAITAEGIENLENANKESYVYIGVKATEDTADILSEAYSKEGITTDTLKLFVDISILCGTTAENAVAKTELDEGDMLTFYIPLSGIYQNKTGYRVYRMHDEKIDVITTTPNDNGEYIELIDSGKTLKMVACKFSVYGIGYLPQVIVDPTPDEGVTPKPDEETTPKPDEETTPKPDEETTPKPDEDTAPEEDGDGDSDTENKPNLNTENNAGITSNNESNSESAVATGDNTKVGYLILGVIISALGITFDINKRKKLMEN